MLVVLACRSSRPALRLAVSASLTRKYSLPSEPPKKSKVWDSADEAVADVKSGDVLLCGGVFHLFVDVVCEQQ
jgi:3-oxoacid CoA-transferase